MDVDTDHVVHALFGIVWTNLDDKSNVIHTMHNIRMFVHRRVTFWKRDKDVYTDQLAIEQENITTGELMTTISESAYGRLCTLYALFACRMGIMVINANRALLPAILTPVTQNPTKVSQWCAITRWSDVYNLDVSEQQIRISDIPMMDKLYPRGLLTDANELKTTKTVGTTIRSIHYESVATLAENALVELYIHVTLGTIPRTTLGYELLDILDRSSDLNVERRVYRWYTSIVPQSTPFSSPGFQILAHQQSHCKRLHNTPIEGARTPGMKPRNDHEESNVPKMTNAEIEECVYAIFYDTARETLKQLWDIPYIQYTMQTSASKKFQFGKWTIADPVKTAQAKVAYNKLQSHNTQRIPELEAEEHICLATMQLVKEWLSVVTDATNKLSVSQRIITSLTAMFENFTGLLSCRDGRTPPLPPRPPMQRERIGRSLGSYLSRAVSGAVPSDIAEKLCNFVALQAMTKYHTGHFCCY
jgi:hypothetical protein